MRKVLVSVAAILITAWLGAPFASGLIVERQFRAQVEKINKLYSDAALGIMVEITRFDRGFSSSEVEWRLNLGKLSSLYGVKDVVFHDRVTHELTGAVVETSLAKNPDYERIIKTKLDGKDPLHITSRWHILTGEWTATTVLDAFSISVDGQALQVKPARMVTTIDKELKHFVCEGTWEGVTANGLGALDRVSLQSDMMMETMYLWSGHAAIVILGGRVEDANVPISFANIKINQVQEHDKGKGRLAGKVEYSADQLIMGGQKVENAFVRLAMNGINAPAYEEFMRQYLAAFSKVLAEIDMNAQPAEQVEKALEQQMGQIGLQLLGPAEKLLTKGLEFQVADLHFTLPEGEVNGSMSLGLNQDMTFAQFVPLANQPELALKIFSLKSYCSLPKGLLGDDPTPLLTPAFPGVQTGFFVDKGQRAEHKAEIKEGKLLLNDTVVELR